MCSISWVNFLITEISLFSFSFFIFSLPLFFFFSLFPYFLFLLHNNYSSLPCLKLFKAITKFQTMEGRGTKKEHIYFSVTVFSTYFQLSVLLSFSCFPGQVFLRGKAFGKEEKGNTHKVIYITNNQSRLCKLSIIKCYYKALSIKYYLNLSKCLIKFKDSWKSPAGRRFICW